MKVQPCILLITILILGSSCEGWLDINKDPNNPSEANEELALSAGITSVADMFA